MAEFNNSLGNIGGSFNQDNIFVKKFITFSTTQFPGLDIIANSFNNLPTFTIDEKEILIINVSPRYAPQVEGYIPEIKKFFLKELGKGIYGQDGTQISAYNLELFYHQKMIVSDIEDDPTTQLIDLGWNITGTNISDYINLLDPSILFQSQNDGYVLIKVINNGINESYLFLGDGGYYGLNDLQTVINDFQLIPDTTPIQELQDLQSVLDEGTTANINEYFELSSSKDIHFISNENELQLNDGTSVYSFDFTGKDFLLNSIGNGQISTNIFGFDGIEINGQDSNIRIIAPSGEIDLNAQGNNIKLSQGKTFFTSALGLNLVNSPNTNNDVTKGLARDTNGDVVQFDIPNNNGYIPLNGTLPGNIVTGDIEYSEYDLWAIKYYSGTNNNSVEGIYLDDGNFRFRHFNPDNSYETYFGFGGENVLAYSVNSDNPEFKGIIGDRYFEKQNDPLAFTQLQDLQNGYIPISGTLLNNPVTGEIEVTETAKGIWIKGSDFPDNCYGVGFGEGSVSLYSQALDKSISIGVNSEDVTINTNNPLSKGLVGNEIFDKQNNPNAYVQLQDVTDLIDDIPSIVIDSLPTPSSTNAVSSGGVVTYIDTQLSSVYKPAGDWDASGNTFPIIGTGTSGVIRRGDTYKVIVSGTPVGFEPLDVGDSFYAIVSNPGQTASNWGKFETNTAQATESFRGTSRIATNILALAGTDNIDYMTALKVRNAIDDRTLLNGGNPTATMYGTTTNTNASIIRNGLTQVVFSTNDVGVRLGNAISGVGNTAGGRLIFGGRTTNDNLFLVRSVADASPVFELQNTNITSTGDYLSLKTSNASASIGGFRNDGRGYGSNATVSNDFITLSQLQSASYKGKGQSIQSGNGTSTSFTITHGLTGITSTNQIFITPRTLASANIQYITLNSTQVTIFYNVAPITGTNNLTWDWQII